MFTHLHVHTEYSLLDGAARIKDVVARAKELGMDSLAITDHGVMFGVVDFYKECKKQGIKPIIGCEVYTAKRKYTDKDPEKDKHQGHLILLAKNEAGYQSLIKIVSEGFVNGYYYKPRIDKDVLRANSEGLICLSACLAGEVQSRLLNHDYEGAKKEATELLEIFGEGNFYLELQDQGLEEEVQILPDMKRLSRELNVPLVATNDVHYVNREDAKAHDVLLAIQTGTTLDDENRMRFPNDEFYLKSENEMRKIFAHTPEAIDNTQVIADACNFDFEFGNYHLPEFKAPDGLTNEEYIRKICKEGLLERYGVDFDGENDDNNDPRFAGDERFSAKTLRERLSYELNTIINMGYVEYFLIVWDFINFAKTNGIVVGPGRGSAAGSIVAYTMKITDIDPIRYNLIFERFLNPERVSMPDIDVDFCYERRQEVIEYVTRKYGEGRVSQIITFGTMKAKQAVRDVGRVLGVSYAKTDLIAKSIPFALDMTIDKALEMPMSELKKLCDEDDEIRDVVDMAKSLEGMPRHASTHAAGVVISKLPIDCYVPLYASDKGLATQFTMTTIEELGLLKMDFLGLRNLTVIRDALKLIKYNHGVEIDFSKMTYDDPAVYEMIASGNTSGVFQLESGGMTQFMRNLKPTCFEDVVAGISLYRPGPMDSIPKYIENKKNPEKIKYVTDQLAHILDVTYGCLVYQEQVMQIVRDLGGYSYGRSDLVRRAMSKKKHDVMLKEKEYFINGIVDENGKIEVPGCIRNGVPKEAAEAIYEDMVTFASYAFNKSHAAAYAVLAYETAYLKYYYPVEFMAALMTSVMGDMKQTAKYIRNCAELGIEILPPSVNYSYKKYSVEDGKIRYGLLAVKNVGAGAVDAIVESREKNGIPKDIFTFIENVDVSQVNKKALESLIKAGACDCLSENRAALLAVYEGLIESQQNTARKNIEGQMSLFQMDIAQGAFDDQAKLPDVKPFTKDIDLALEKEMLGVYLTDHPLNSYIDKINKWSSIGCDVLNAEPEEDDIETVRDSNLHDGMKVIICGMITGKKTMITKSNKMMAFIDFEDLYGTCEIIVFPNVYEKCSEYLMQDKVVVVRGTLNFKEGEAPKILANDVIDINVDELPPEQIYQKTRNSSNNYEKPKIEESDYTTGPQITPEGLVKLRIPANLAEGPTLEQIKTTISRHHGNWQVLIYLPSGKVLKTQKDLWVEPSGVLRAQLIAILGQENVKI